MKRVVLTGAGGYLGSRLARELARRSCALVLVARDFDRTKNAIGDASEAVIGGCSVDLASPTSRREALHAGLFDACDAVFHLGADLSFLGSPTQIETNVVATRELFALAARAGVRSFVFASSVDATGSSHRAEPRDIDEYGVLSPYGLSKLRAERCLLAEKSDTSIGIARLGILVGEDDNFTPGLEALVRDRPDLTATLLDQHIPITATTAAIDALTSMGASAVSSRRHVIDDNPTLRDFLAERGIVSHGDHQAEETEPETEPETALETLEAHCLDRIEQGVADLASYLAWPTPRYSGRRLRS